MTGINIITKIIVIIGVIVISVISPCFSAISDRRLCFDSKCSVPVSIATTVLSYPSNDPDILSFGSNVEVQVFSKSAGSRKDLWGVEINGKRGYVPSKMLKEKKILRKNLLHEVPTERTAATVPSDDSKNKETEKLNNVPKVSELTDGAKKIDMNSENINEIVKEPHQSVPILERVSPSYEIHDGTTIPFPANDEPSEPSYATQVLQGVVDVGEQPILSIHPNIASTMTLKPHAEELPFVETVENAENYFKTTASEILSSPGEVIEEAVPPKTELPSEAAGSEEFVNAENEEAGIKREDSVLKGIESVKDLPEATKDVPSSRDNVEKAAEDLEDEDDSENDEEEDSEEESENPEENKEPVEQKNAVSDPKPNEEEAKSVLEQPLQETTESELPENNVDSGKSSLVETNIALENNTLENNSIDEIITEENPGAAFQANVIDDKVEENLSINGEANEEPMKVDSINAEQETQPKAEVFADVWEETKSEQRVEEKTEETLPSNLKIMNPLFNSFSKLPALMKEVVDNAISGSADEESSVSTDEMVTAESEVKVPTETPPDIKEPSSPLVDFATDFNNNNDYQNNTDDSIKVEEDPKQETEVSHAEEISDITESSSLPVDFSTDIDSNDYQNETDNLNPASILTEKETANTFETVNSGEFVDNYNILDKSINDSTADKVETQTSQDFTTESPEQPGIYKDDELSGFRQDNFAIDDTSSFSGFPANRNLLNVGSTLQPEKIAESSLEAKTTVIADSLDQTMPPETEKMQENSEEQNVEQTTESASIEYIAENTESTEKPSIVEEATRSEGDEVNHEFLHETEESTDNDFTSSIKIGRNFWETFSYVVLTAFTTLLFSLGYYYIENTRRDGQLIAKINKLEKELLVSSKECTVLDDTLKSTKSKLDSIEDESFGSNEMVVSLKADLEASKTAKSELEDQVAMLEKELESATEAGLELERMLREILSTNNEDNPLAQSVEDLQTRLNAQQAANEALTNSLNLKAQENESLTSDLAAMTQRCEQLEVEVTRITTELKHQNNIKSNMEQTMLDKLEHLEKQVKDLSVERANLRKQLKGKEMEMKDLLEVVNQMNVNNLDFEKLYNVSSVKAEASQLLEERDDLQIRLSEVEGAHQLLEEHVKLINEEVSSLSEQCKLAEKAKRDAETRVEVLSNFFKEKEAQRQKEEAVWLEKQGEVSSTVERLHTMQNEIHNYKQQIEMLKREILDQEREYKNQIATLETKSHEQWVVARQHERRLEESKAEAGQLRNRLTLIEKNLNDTDPEAKLHRLETNGDSATSPQLFMGAEASSSPIMFTGSSGVPLPPPPSYLYGPPVPPFMPPLPHSSSGIPPYEVGQRPPPLGGRLSSPPPLHGSGSSRYDNPRSPPPPLSPSMLPPFGPPSHRAYPPPFANDRIHPPMPPPHSSMLPPPLGGSSHNWGDDTLPPLRNSGFQPHQQHHRDQRARNHKGSLHSSGESLDKNV